MKVRKKWIGPQRQPEGLRATSIADFKETQLGGQRITVKQSAQLYPVTGQTPIIRPYKSDVASREVQLSKFEVWDNNTKMFFDKFHAYTDNTIGNELHRQDV